MVEVEVARMTTHTAHTAHQERRNADVLKLNCQTAKQEGMRRRGATSRRPGAPPAEEDDERRG
jgi:hypothetical protein